MAAAELKRLRWRCRRGMRELDLLLETWLERHGNTMGSSDSAVFARFLDCTDMEIYDWVTGRGRPESAEFCAIVDQLIKQRD